jgi:protoporphyrin/coproporphyrin ferrochelatase
MKPPYDALLMVGFGGPTRAEEIRPFLENVVRGRPIPPARLEEVARHYEHMGGCSPYNEETLRQADALRELLAREGPAIAVYIGMRNWAPYVSDAIREIAAAKARRVFCFVMAPHRSEASWDRYRDTVAQALAPFGADAPAIDYAPRWHNHPLFIGAVAARVREAMQTLGAAERIDPEVIFTAHSIPIAMDARSAYAAEIAESCRLTAREVGLARWQVAYQSRSGNPREPWLEPDVAQMLRGLAGRAAVVMPIGFICDHVEVLYDLDVEAAAVARECGVTMRRAPTVGTHPLYIRMIGDLLRHAARDAA